eukprot:4478491-Amphidinium_carterae.1
MRCGPWGATGEDALPADDPPTADAEVLAHKQDQQSPKDDQRLLQPWIKKTSHRLNCSYGKNKMSSLRPYLSLGQRRCGVYLNFSDVITWTVCRILHTWMASPLVQICPNLPWPGYCEVNAKLPGEDVASEVYASFMKSVTLGTLAVIDTGAQSSVVGEKQFEYISQALSQHGLQAMATDV